MKAWWAHLSAKEKTALRTPGAFLAAMVLFALGIGVGEGLAALF